MNKLISGIFRFAETAIIAGLIGSGVCLIATEVRLAALKKASLGPTKLTKFTERMTGTKLFQN
jgi:hypothetical protein